MTVAYTPFLRTVLRFDSIQITQDALDLGPRHLLDLSKDGYWSHIQHPVRLGRGLFVFLAATGKLYESDSLPDGDSLRFRRIDSTQHEGYNISAYIFPHRGRVHNLGGYGFWHWNGQLRAFNRRMREWEIVPFDREVAVATGSPECFPWHDMRRERIYLIRGLLGNEAVKGDPIRLDEEVRMLDLAAGEWKSLGVHTDYCRNQFEERKILAASDSGLVIVQHNTVEYWLPGENRILVLSDITPLAEITARMFGKFIWMRKGWLYTGNPGTGAIDSIVLHTGMFRDTGERIYKSPSLFSWQDLLIFLPAAGLVFLIGFLATWMPVVWGQGRQPQATVDDPTGTSDAESPTRVSSKVEDAQSGPERPVVFDAVERSLLGLLIWNATEGGRRTTSQEINRVLGVGSKSLDMQKRKRSDVIRAINKKYRLVRPDRGHEPIVKERGDIDARLSEYCLHPEELSTVAALLESP